ncbi:hypothetical protein BH09ACT3_BH09ACT3_08640 [soil metagenome]
MHPTGTFAAEHDGRTENGDVPPAPRFVIAQSWWVAAEVARRHPVLIIHEMHPGGGMYDCLALLTPDGHKPIVQLNRVGTLHIPAVPEYRVDWNEVMSARSPHAVVKEIEEVAQLGQVVKAPKSTPRVLAYRFIATLLTMTVNDRHAWDARNEFLDSSGDELLELRGYLDGFPKAQRDSATTPPIGLWQEPHSHFWAVLRDEEPIAMVSIEGWVYRRDTALDLALLYSESGHSITRVVTAVLGDLLP